MNTIEALMNMRENGVLEVKTAKYGLPKSIWETYSSFANTSGGTILLGVKEDENKNLIPAGLTSDEASNLVTDFFNILHSNKVSLNILTEKNVRVETIGNNYIVIINIPKATRFDKPIYLNNDVFNSYRRNHEGDYKCSKQEVLAMLRDSEIGSYDALIVKHLKIENLSQDTINSYRLRFINAKGPSHPFSNEPLELFLRHIGAAKYDDDDILRPTKAGLLMFGYDYDIREVFPNYFLDYQDKRNITPDMRWVNRIYSSTGDWSGNLYDFYFRIVTKLTEDVLTPFKMDGILRIDITPMHKAIREALCNCLSNADFNESTGVVIKQYNDKIEFSNPGCFPITKEVALAGGISDARNKTILTLFNNINIGERTGSGIPLIYSATKELKYKEPIYKESLNPDYTVLTIYLTSNLDKDNGNLDIQSPNLDIDDNNLDIQKPDLNIDGHKLDIQKPNLDIDDNNLDIQIQNINNKINNLKIADDLKSKLLKISNNLAQDTFSTSNITKLLNCARSSAYNYLNILLNNNLIIPVKGEGKAKYRFMK